MARAQLTKCASLQEVGRHRRQCGRLCAARPAIEQRDFAEDVAGDGDLEAQLAPPGSRGRETNLAFGEQIEVRARIAAREQQLTLVETGLAKALRTGREIVRREATEKLGVGEESSYRHLWVRSQPE